MSSVPNVEPNFAVVLLEEARHRHANEFASALASLQLVRARSTEREPLIEDAIRRLEGNVRIERLLLAPDGNDLGMLVLELCSLLSLTRPGRPRFRVRFLRRPVLRDHRLIRLILLVAYELLGNAARRSNCDDAEILIRIAAGGRRLRISVTNHIGTDHSASRGGARGLEILRQLTAPFGGRIACRQEADRFVAHATFPVEVATQLVRDTD